MTGRPPTLNEGMRVTARVPAALCEKLGAHAVAMEVNRSSLVRQLLEEQLNAEFRSAPIKRSERIDRGKQRASLNANSSCLGGAAIRRLIGSLPGSQGSKGARPRTMEEGTNMTVRLPILLVNEVDRYAASGNVTRSRAIWKILEEAVEQAPTVEP